MIAMDDLVTDYEATQQRHKKAFNELRALEEEKLALFNLIVARGGGSRIGASKASQKGAEEKSKTELNGNALTPYGTVKAAVLATSGDFTAKEIFEAVSSRIKAPKAVTYFLRKLTDDGIIEVTIQGQGRREGQYRLV